MALGENFCKLWQDSSFRSKVQAIVVDEAHCIVEWGDKFRKEYSGLAKLQDYIGQEIPILACTATCSSKTFEVIWSSLAFGFRPFWGLDVGVDRKNLSFIVHVLENTANPVLDALNILPAPIPEDINIPNTVLPKSLFYFETINQCNSAMETLRKILPAHYRDSVQMFTSIASEDAKAQIWDNFRTGSIRILCATDAAGMGCNVPDVAFVVLFSVPRSISTLTQRWGRAGRSRDIEATCILFVQGWAFRPQGVHLKTKKGKEKPLESATFTANRAKIDPPLEKLINLGHDEKLPSGE
ncbi:hypothetical protein HYPSUDRAFT_149055 [Hypholoma sublateritium FD-334 SS-4]|uniref:DNA 3'-5' helicase n=1 Tax=Hypholoma sublateritium (strain FD-334 SS-4) TaxID=945553 RepID=A0A0D2LX91_HYPSF|nr:hypothetical protein HYPSUDRAFT_149055 [Hypholoma sublateritium FD-334 SS-4]